MSTFRAYDDEGYFLLTLKHYFGEGHLYTHTFSQYGPFYFVAQTIFFKYLHFQLDHDGGRLVVLVYWLASGLFAGLFVHKMSRSVLVGCTAGLACLNIGAVLVDEPGHPQQVLLLLLMIAAYVSVLSESNRPDVRVFTLGGIGAALALTKINVGFFFVVAFAYAMFCLVSPNWIRSLGLSAAFSYATAGPWLLMHSDFHRGVRGYCGLATLVGIATFAFGSLNRPPSPWPARILLPPALSFLIVAASVLGVPMSQGVSASALIQGVIINPSKHHDVFLRPLHLTTPVILAALVITAALIVFFLLRNKLKDFSISADLLRLLVGTIVILLLLLLPPIRVLPWLLPFLPLSVIPSRRQSISTVELFPRLFVTGLAATQFLQGYPVAGSQISIAASLVALWAFLCIAGAMAGLEAREKVGAEYFLSQLSSLTTLIIALAVLLTTAFDTALRFNSLPPRSTLAGSSLLHLQPQEEQEYESIARTVAANCTVLFTMPGMGSFNFWSGVPTPDGSNVTVWTRAFDARRQQDILNRLRSSPDACVISSPELLSFWTTSTEEAATLPLGHYILYDMPKRASIGRYEVRTNADRRSIWRDVSR